MKSTEIRNTFFEFFRSKQHTIVPSAPMVVKDDPSLMFTNAGMNQFKDIFLGNAGVTSPRIADTQKCLRVSGKHNDLEEVGHDTYHHTMFEMLGNWSFGDYFKNEAIAWAWELLTEVYGIDKDTLYVTVFGGDESDGLQPDNDAFAFWKALIPENRILYGSKKDNFWEMGDTGPCGPCSEIHVDLRPDEEKKKISGADLVNTDHPLVIEIWNLVFIEFNRKANGSLEKLPSRHVDTGMGFERLAMVLQGKKSNYDTDVFQPIIQRISTLCNIPYGNNLQSDIAMRVIADHLRAVSFAIADGQLPSNVKAGYVIRRILRRAVRYAYTFLHQEEALLHKLIPVLVNQLGDVFPELRKQEEIIRRVISEEEMSFLRTLATGIQRFRQYLDQHPTEKLIDGSFAFELFDTYGFPIDLTRLMAKEESREVDMQGFEEGLQAQKNRSRADAATDTGDWTVLIPGTDPSLFLGWDHLESEAQILRYREVVAKKQSLFQIVLNQTPFYAEAGGQVGDQGLLIQDEVKIPVLDTRKENNLIIHLTSSLPPNPSALLNAKVDIEKRSLTAVNHSATHLLHFALRDVLGTHVEQKGSSVDPERLRFDFSHFSKLSEEEIHAVEQKVNRMIRANIDLDEMRDISMESAMEMGAMALFGEKYGDKVRLVRFGDSVELCGGTHVHATGQIGLLIIRSEAAIAAGVRRIEAISGSAALDYLQEKQSQLELIREMFKNTNDPVRSVKDLIETQKETEKKLYQLEQEQLKHLSEKLRASVMDINGIQFLAQRIDLPMQQIKDLAFDLEKELKNAFLVFGSGADGKPGLTVMLSRQLTEDNKMNAGSIVRTLARHIEGGGGGQTHFATAGGKNLSGLDAALQAARDFIK